ncbi:MAG: AraC family transcriptional regulator [Marinilabiliaceae bacterium]|nr:AraC family transcriptional regulator [Marinilabiliaceae bacterium]
MKKQDGFPGQISYVIPEKVQQWISLNPLISDLYLTDVGYYPNAKHHYRERSNGLLQYILIYCTLGKGTVNIENQKFDLLADHYIIIPSGKAHSYFSSFDDPWSIYWIHFGGRKASFFSNRSIQPVLIERGKLSRISIRLSLFEEIFRNLERGFSSETLEYVNLCLIYLLSSFSHIQQFKTINDVSDKDPVALSINYMLENLNRTIRLDEFSKVVNLSVSYYSKIFVEKTNYSPIDYFNQLKIQRACRLLDITDLSVADVACEIGFKDSFYFSRLFKKVMNISPFNYKRRNMK